MTCLTCGNEIKPGLNFCTRCGTKAPGAPGAQPLGPPSTSSAPGNAQPQARQHPAPPTQPTLPPQQQKQYFPPPSRSAAPERGKPQKSETKIKQKRASAGKNERPQNALMSSPLIRVPIALVGWYIGFFVIGNMIFSEPPSQAVTYGSLIGILLLSLFQNN